MIRLSDYILKQGLSEREIAKQLLDPLVRLCNLYTIIDADGNHIRFRPNSAQFKIAAKIYLQGYKRIAVPKARQRGISTLAAMMALDIAYFGENKQCSIVDRTHGDAEEKLHKAKIAYDELPQALKAGNECKTDSRKTLAWGNKSSIHAGKNARGGTNQFLHISEWGVIAYEDPARSLEIKTGAIPSVSGQDGVILAESTFKGGRGGDWYNVIQQGLDNMANRKDKNDWTVLFFPWWEEKRYRQDSQIDIKADTRAYFEELEQVTGAKFDDQQQRWYQTQSSILGKHMLREYPSTLEESWQASEDGAIYAKDLDRAREEGRLSNNIVQHAGFPVYTSFDIGAAKNQKCWIFQIVGDRIIYLEALTGSDECKTPAQWAARLKAKSYAYGAHFFPHDAETLWKQLLRDAQLDNCIILPRQKNVWDGINAALQNFNRCSFVYDTCKEGIDSLTAYHSKIESDGTTVRDVPVHDWSSHYADAFSIGHQAIELGMIQDRSALPKRADVRYLPTTAAFDYD